jgi:outer membrane protein assembly factor BamB
MVYALDRATGKEIWNRDTHAQVTGSPVLMGDKLIVGNRGGVLVALNPVDGKTIWRMLFWGSSVESTASPGEASLFYIGSSDMRRVSLIDSSDGRVVWRTDVFGWAWPKPLVTADRIYMSVIGVTPYQMRHLGSLNALDRATGKILWRWPMPEWPGALLSGFAAPPVLSGSRLIVGGLDGTLYIFPV